MKNLEIGDTFKNLGKYGRMFALAATIGATTICFSGCGNEKDNVAALEKDGQILQLLRLSSGKSCTWKVGYFELNEGDLHFKNAFKKDEDTNLSYLLTISDGVKMDFCDYASLCNTDILLSYQVTKTQSDDILDSFEKNNVDEKNTFDYINSNSKYSSKEDVNLKNISINSSYEAIIEITSLKKATQEAPQKKKK